MRLLTVTLLLLLSTSSAHAWKLELGAHQYKQAMDYSQSLTKNFGSWRLALQARQFDSGKLEGSHLNLSLGSKSWGAELLQGRYVAPAAQRYSISWPSYKKPDTYATPASEVLHLFVRQEWGAGVVDAHWYDKDDATEWELNVEAEF